MLIHMKDRNLLTATNSLQITKEQEDICKVLYRRTGDGYLLCGFYDPDIRDEDYPDGLAAFSFKSSFGGYVVLAGGSNVFNVIGSKDDKYKIGTIKSNDSWIKIWEDNITNYDAQLDITNPLPGGQRHNNHTRRSYVDQLPGRTDTELVGGHICQNQASQNPGRGGSCLLLPIYKYLNSMGAGAQMTVINGGAVALQLINFLK